MRLVAFLLFLLIAGQAAASAQLRVVEKTIEVNGKEAVVYSVERSNGMSGLKLNQADGFDVHLVNSLVVPTSLHWHGLMMPNRFDGVAFVTQYPIYPGLS